MASISDVAKLANVAKSTVSIVINNSGYVSEETRKKVEKAIEELNYQPSQLARNLSKNRTDLIGVVIPDISHPFFGTYVKYVEEALYHLGYKTMICDTLERENMEQEFINMLKRQTMDGIIMGAHSLLQEKYEDLKKPIVGFDRNLGKKIPLIHADHRQGGIMAAELMLAKGRKHIVQISGSLNVDTPAHQSHLAFEDTLKANQVKCSTIRMNHNAFNQADFQKTACELFDTYPDVDGILGADLAVMSCLREAKKRKITVPKQLSIVAYDGTYITQAGEREITAVVQPIKELAYACADTIDKLVKKEKIAQREIVYPVRLQVGETA